MEKTYNNRELNRRMMLKRLGLGAAGGALSLSGSGKLLGMANAQSSEPGSIDKVPAKPDSMKIVKVESIRFSDRINIGGGSGGDGKAEFCWLRIHTDKGIVGIGE